MLKSISRPNYHRRRFRAGHRSAAYEWWYAHGYLTNERSRHFGFMVSFFKFNKKKIAQFFPDLKYYPGSTIYVLDQGFSDITGQTHQFDEQVFVPYLGRVGFGKKHRPAFFAANRLSKYTVRGRDVFDLHVSHADRDLHLHLAAQKKIIPHGQNGIISIAGLGRTNYYSYSRLKVEGAMSRNLGLLPRTVKKSKAREKLRSSKGAKTNKMARNKTETTEFVHGQAWIDHQWGDFLTHQPLLFWTWIAVQLEDNQEIMIFVFYDSKGQIKKTSATFVDQKSNKSRVRVKLTPLTNWTSPKTGIAYPIDYLIVVPRRQLELHLTADIKDQEMPSKMFAYWEGSCSVNGLIKKKPISGKAYLEQTGFDRLTAGGLKKRLA